MTGFNCWLVAIGLLWLLTPGCGRPPDPYSRQVSRALEASLKGEELLSEGQDRRAAKAFTKSLQISRSIDHPSGAARQLNNLAAVALTRGDTEEAKALFHQALVANRALGHDAGAAINLANLATIAQTGGDLPRAEQYLQEALAMARESGSLKVRGQVLCQMAGLAVERRDFGAAAAYLEEARPASREADVRGSWNYQQGRLALARGEPGAAQEFFYQALAADRVILNRTGMGADLQGLGNAAEAQGDFSRAFLYYSRAFELYAATNRADKARLCLEALRRVNKGGGLGRSLQPFEEQLKTAAAAPPASPPGAPLPPDQAGPADSR